MVRRSSMNETTAKVSFLTHHLGYGGSTKLTVRFVILQQCRALAINLLIGLDLPILNVALCA